MLALSELFGPSILGLLLPMAAYTCALGLVLPHAMATALRHFPNTAGTASALFGFVQMALSATTAAVVARLLDDNPRPVVLTMLVVTVVSLLLLSRLHRQRDTGSAVAGR
jgi:DHA1 family bicyclomycin/chloramphenicol resistance-like MFS transporter